MEKYYVYQWFNIETNEIFYVGKGTGNRYKKVSNRNKYFLNYYNNNPVSVEIVKYFENEQDAFDYEKELTDKYRKQGMCKCNLMDGGFGGYSNIWTEEMKKYRSEFNPMKSPEQRQRISEFNPMKNPKIANRVNSQKKRPVVINGIEYPGVIDAAIAHQVYSQTITSWCKRGYDTQGNPCRYLDEEQKNYVYKKTSSKAILIDDVEYPSLKAAATALGVKDTSPLCKALKLNKPYKGHICKYANQQPS